MARCLETIDVCIWRMFVVCCSDCVGVCGNVCCVAAVVKNSGFFSLGVLKYVVCLCRGCDGCCGHTFRVHTITPHLYQPLLEVKIPPFWISAIIHFKNHPACLAYGPHLLVPSKVGNFHL